MFDWVYTFGYYFTYRKMFRLNRHFENECQKRISPYSVQMRENTGQKELRIWTHSTQWYFNILIEFLTYFVALFLYALKASQNLCQGV